MRRAVAERLSRRELYLTAKAAGADVDEATSRARLVSIVTHDEGRRSQNPQRRHVWTDEDIAVMQGHADWSAEEIAAELGTTTGSVEYARKRYGRFPPRDASGLCVVCDSRPVYAESPEAKRLGLCKGCWQEEQRKRLEEEPEAVRLRQAKKRKGQ